jgi:hypothetical protein
MNSVLSEDSLADWLQANWEIIVESRLRDAALLNGLLDVYAYGADCNGSSSRVSLPESIANAAIHVHKGFVMHSFGTLKDDFFVQSAPFDYVKGENASSEIVLRIDEAQFSIGGSYDSIAI